MNIGNESFAMQWETSEYSTSLVWYKDVMDVLCTRYSSMNTHNKTLLMEWVPSELVY